MSQMFKSARVCAITSTILALLSALFIFVGPALADTNRARGTILVAMIIITVVLGLASCIACCVMCCSGGGGETTVVVHQHPGAMAPPSGNVSMDQYAKSPPYAGGQQTL